MRTLTQNRKIAISTIAVFLASFSFVLVFLGGSDENAKFAQTDVMGAAADNRIIFATDAGGNILGASDPFCLITGTDCSDIKSYKVFDLIHSDDLSGFASVHAELLQEGEGADGLGPFRFVNEKSDDRLLLLGARPHKEGSKIAKIVFLAKDLTEHIRRMTDDADDEEDESDESSSPGENWFKKLYPNTPPKLLVEKA